MAEVAEQTCMRDPANEIILSDVDITGMKLITILGIILLNSIMSQPWYDAFYRKSNCLAYANFFSLYVNKIVVFA